MKYCPKIGQMCDKSFACYDEYLDLCVHTAQARALVDIAKSLAKIREELP